MNISSIDRRLARLQREVAALNDKRKTLEFEKSLGALYERHAPVVMDRVIDRLLARMRMRPD